MKKSKSNISIIFREFSKKYPKQFLLLFLFLVIEGVSAVLSMLAIIPMADFLIDPSLSKASKITHLVIKLFNTATVTPTFISFGLLFVFLNLLKGVIEVGVKYAILRIKYDVIHGLFGDTLEVFFNAKWGFFSNVNNGMLLNTLNKELTTIGDTLGHIALLFAQIVQVIIFLAVPMWLNYRLTLTIFLISVLFGLPFLLLNNLTYKLGKKNTESANEAMSVLNELLQAAKLILGYGKQKKSKDIYLAAFKKHVNVTLKSQTLSTAIPKFFQPIAMMSVVIAISLSLKNNALISELTAVMWSFLSVLPILATLLQGNISINNFMPSYEQLFNLRSEANNFKEIQGENEFTSLVSSIEFKDVSFAYSSNKSTISHLNLTINKGDLTALIGESGSGKSTITDLVLGLQIPMKGEVLIDGVSLNNYKQNSFRQKIGYVPQDPMLFNCSIRDNLLWAKEDATEIEIIHSLKLANADKFINDLPEGLDTLVGERGQRLSGGQRQRIALARALIRKPELLILDEATSALDSESEKLIQSSIDNLSRETTLLVIAHRLSTIINANQVYVLKKGEVIESGSFAELSKKENGELKKMILNQMPK